MFENTADFTNMTENSGLKVTKVVQKVVIEVNEEGSEAAVASGSPKIFVEFIVKTNFDINIHLI